MNMQLNEKAAFIKGVIEGLELDPKDKRYGKYEIRP